MVPHQLRERVAVVPVNASSGNGQNSVTLDLCVGEDAISIP
ncbi:hypothetical protein RHOER0001_4618 [Rhodococcus erythropolis SK121]|jgi:hypothetical protein|nr:hypothetical protein RHOER0001_4618 [Rhodococcus erythropolis SK121]